MCICTPSIKSPYCQECMPKRSFNPYMEAAVINNTYETKIKYAHEKIKAIVCQMDGLSKDGFTNKYLNDPSFHKGIEVLVHLLAEKEG